MSGGIVSSVKSRHSNRRINYNQNNNVRIGGGRRHRFDVNKRLNVPENYPPSKFIIASFHGITLTNPNNFTKDGVDEDARYVIHIGGNGKRFSNNLFWIMEQYCEYDWNGIFTSYPKDVASYEYVKQYFIETKRYPARSVFEFDGKFMICGNQPNDNTIGMVRELFDFDSSEYRRTKDLAGATTAAPPQSKEILKGREIVAGDDGSYLLKLQLACTERELNMSQTLNNLLSGKITDTTRNALNMLNDRIGRHVTENGTKKPINFDIDFPTNVVKGPKGMIQAMQTLSGKQWDTQEDQTMRQKKVKYDNTQYRSVFGAEKSIRTLKNGKFFIVNAEFTVIEKKRKGVLVKAPKTKIHVDGIVNGKLQTANGSFQWLRPGQ